MKKVDGIGIGWFKTHFKVTGAYLLGIPEVIHLGCTLKVWGIPWDIAVRYTIVYIQEASPWIHFDTELSTKPTTQCPETCYMIYSH